MTSRPILAAAAAVLVVVPGAYADVVDSGTVNITIPRTFDGLEVDVVTGATSTTFGLSSSDFNIYASSANWFNFSRSANTSSDPDGGIALDGTVIKLFSAGDTVGPAENFDGGVDPFGGAGPFDGYIGFSFFNEAGGTQHFGYAQLSLPATGDGTLISYGYESSPNTALVIPVPEPTSLALLGAGGLVVLRRRRSA